MRFAIGGVFIREKEDCHNVQNKLTYIVADSKEEAIGKFIKEGFDQFPKHSLFMTPLILCLDMIENEKDN